MGACSWNCMSKEFVTSPSFDPEKRFEFENADTLRVYQNHITFAHETLPFSLQEECSATFFRSFLERQSSQRSTPKFGGRGSPEPAQVSKREKTIKIKTKRRQ